MRVLYSWNDKFKYYILTIIQKQTPLVPLTTEFCLKVVNNKITWLKFSQLKQHFHKVTAQCVLFFNHR